MDSQRDSRNALGAAVEALRLRTGLTQEDLAARANLDADLIARVEAGEADPTWGDARRIAAALGTSVDRLAALAEELEDEA
ncbi:MAG TPA: helix-turn-helix transcriptional regulator [Solirubrobacterales bacterium]|nr:helix-turn-helix transcriptional regulator [Solirubrobacterales bacterium]